MEQLIKSLEKAGYNIWSGYGKLRAYADLEKMGLEYQKSKRGYVCWSFFRGEEIAHSKAQRWLDERAYIDLLEDCVVAEDRELRVLIKEDYARAKEASTWHEEVKV